MNQNYLFQHKYKKIGWIILIPALIILLLSLFLDFEFKFLDVNTPAIFVEHIFETNNLLDEIILISILVGSLLVAFSKEKVEDEYILKIRLESLVWSVYVNCGILILSILLIYELEFLLVMVFNLFAILLIFIIIYYWKLFKFRKSIRDEK